LASVLSSTVESCDCETAASALVLQLRTGPAAAAGAGTGPGRHGERTAAADVRQWMRATLGAADEAVVDDNDEYDGVMRRVTSVAAFWTSWRLGGRTKDAVGWNAPTVDR